MLTTIYRWRLRRVRRKLKKARANQESKARIGALEDEEREIIFKISARCFKQV